MTERVHDDFFYFLCNKTICMKYMWELQHNVQRIVLDSITLPTPLQLKTVGITFFGLTSHFLLVVRGFHPFARPT